MPQVSVVMGVYNSARFLEKAVQSVLAQTFTDFEFVIIDDGSTDASPAILKKLAEQDRRIRLIHQANAGVSKVGNRGIAESRAPLIARMDADDVCLPDRLEKQVAFMRAHPDVVLLGGAFQMIDQHDHKLITITPPLDDAELQRQCLVGTTPICHPLCMFRRDVALKVGGYDETFPCALDIDLYLRLGEHGQMACLPDLLLQYRQHDGSISEKKQTLQVQYMQKACSSAWQRRGLTDMRFEGAAGWRADGSTQSLFRQHTKFGWWAYKSGDLPGARHYGWRAIRTCPLRIDGYKLLWASLKKGHN